jgi:arsenate reductase-like glutaredoxin family protein
MSSDEERKEKEERKEDIGKVKWEINSIRDELKHELEDIHDNLQEVIEDLREEADDIKEDLKDDLEELMEERNSLLEELGDIKGELDHYGDDKREQIAKAKEKLERLKGKIEGHEAKFDKKVRKKVEKAVKRINISVDPVMSEEWKDWADDLGASVSELVRKSMKFVKNNIGDIAKLEAWGKKWEKASKDIKKAVNKSEIKELGKQLEKKYGNKKIAPKTKSWLSQTDKERVRKRLKGLIKLQKSIPIEKLSQTLNIPSGEAENLIYELAAEGIEGELEEGVFKFTSTPEEVLSKLYDLVDKM